MGGIGLFQDRPGPRAQTQPAANSDESIANDDHTDHHSAEYDQDEFYGGDEGDRTDRTDNGYDDDFSEGGGVCTDHPHNEYRDDFSGGDQGNVHGHENNGVDYSDDNDDFKVVLPENPDDNDVDSNPLENNSPGLHDGTSTQQSDSSERTTQTSNTQSGLKLFQGKKSTESVPTGAKRNAMEPMVMDLMVAPHPSTLSQKKPAKKVTWNDDDDASSSETAFTDQNTNLDAKSHQQPHQEFRDDDDDDESSMVQEDDDAASHPVETAGGGHEKMALSVEDKDETNHDDAKTLLFEPKTQGPVDAEGFAEEMKEAPRSDQSATRQAMEIDSETIGPGLEKAAHGNGLLTTSAKHSGEKISSKNGSLHLKNSGTGTGTIRSVNQKQILPAPVLEVERQTIREGSVNQFASAARNEETAMVSRGAGPPLRNFQEPPSHHATSMSQGNQASKVQNQNSRPQSLLRVGGNNQGVRHGRSATSGHHRHQFLQRSMSGQGGTPKVSKANGLHAKMHGGSSLQRALGLTTTTTNNRGESGSLVPQTTLNAGLTSSRKCNNGHDNVNASKTPSGTLQNQGGDDDRVIPRPRQRLVPTTPSPSQNSTGGSRTPASKPAAMTDAVEAAGLLLKTPTARNSHTEATKPIKDHHAAQPSSTGPPNEITPGPKTASKKSAPPAPGQVRDSMAMIDLDVAMQDNQRIIPAGNETNQRQFETNLETFENTVRDLEDMHQRSETALLDLNVRLSTAYSETLEDQADLSMFLGSLYDLGADFDALIAEYQEFLAD